MNKILVNVYIPTIDKTYEIFLPINLKIKYSFDIIQKTIDEFIEYCLNSKVFKIIIVDDYYTLLKIKDSNWFDSVNFNSGIWIGDNFDSQSIINVKPANTLYDNLDDNTAVIVNNKERIYVNFIKSR